MWVANDRYLDLTSSAAAILNTIAALGSETYVWIDSLCINQKNVEDKNRQVPLMGQIYSSAERVIVWLGPQSQDIVTAMEFVDHLRNSIADLLRRELPVTSDTLTKSAGCEFPSPRWTAIAQFLQRPWFTRSWIIQEVVLAKAFVIVCGNSTLDWSGLSELLSTMVENGLEELLGVEKEGGDYHHSRGVMNTLFIQYMRNLRDKHEPVDLHSILLNCDGFDSTDQRDKIWALLGMSADGLSFIRDVNYKTPPKDVFTRTASKILVKEPSLAILHVAGIGNTRNMVNLPSWVADWTCLPRFTVLGEVAKGMLYNASGATRNSVEIDEKANKMALTGIIFDTVKTVLPRRPNLLDSTPPKEMKETKRRLQTWITEAFNLARSSKQYIDQIGRDQALCAALTGNMSYTDGPGTPGTLKDFENFQAWTENILELTSCEDWEQVVFTSDYVSKVQACCKVLNSMGNRKLYVSRKGYLGMGPEGVRVGDRVTVFYGAATPFLVRAGKSKKGKEGTYALVGECYMHSLMNGEGLGMAEEQRIVLA